ncbi:hypothetical protein A2310_05515 [candidate division WOR-1 bacterium RIFOXYB2_FULL_37_13]|uniref:Uncharacterized protein n=1 Tax=candidate division WOR-1 bacterium RIFOXYB2_FULL_37_13 TaxID=1802579 RepID=A0A1F4SUE8_UNCSA|nr:MAG: hypothetical protein A2310_05515 [candidate division WOR-1 bacterium RIFOXYB2_FULL_37_13]
MSAYLTGLRLSPLSRPSTPCPLYVPGSVNRSSYETPQPPRKPSDHYMEGVSSASFHVPGYVGPSCYEIEIPQRQAQTSAPCVATGGAREVFHISSEESYNPINALYQACKGEEDRLKIVYDFIREMRTRKTPENTGKSLERLMREEVCYIVRTTKELFSKGNDRVDFLDKVINCFYSKESEIGREIQKIALAEIIKLNGFEHEKLTSQIQVTLPTDGTQPAQKEAVPNQLENPI